MLRKTASIFIFVLTVSLLNAQNHNSIEKLLNEYMGNVRTKNFSKSPDKELYSDNNAEEVLKLLENYYTDTVVEVRSKAYYLTSKATYRSQNKELRYKSVYNLVLALKDVDSGITGNAADWLTNFYSNDFNQTTKDSLKKVLNNQNAYLDKVIRLVGFVSLKDQSEYIINNLKTGVYSSNKVIWSAHLALARMGVEDEIEYCVNLVKKQPINDDVIYELFPDLVYIRNKKAINYLVEILHDNNKNCYSANPENPQKIACGYRVMEYLAPIIDNFPLKVDSTGDLITDDYEKALKLVRNWFAEKGNEYVIIKNSY